jgi:hypothetical protein
VTTARNNKQYNLEGTLMYKSHQLRTNAKPADLFYIGTRFYYGNNFPKADSIFTGYITAFPDSVDGYYWRALSRAQMDSGMRQGLAVTDLEKTIQLGESNKPRFKDQAVQAAQMLVLYYNNVKKDRAAAAAVVTKGLEFDPANATLGDLQRRLSGAQKPSAPAKTETKTKTTMADGTEVKTKTKTKNAK